MDVWMDLAVSRGGAWKMRWLRSPKLFQLLLSPMTLIGRAMEEIIGACEK